MIRVYPDLESLSHAAAALLVTQANLAAAARGRFSVALSGGNTPRRTCRPSSSSRNAGNCCG